MRTRIVTDSGAELSDHVVEELGITVVPWSIRLGAEVVADDASLRIADFYRRTTRQKLMPVALAPTRQQMAATFERTSRECDELVAIHTSATFGKVVQAATRARAGILGRCQIRVVDSQFISRAMGNLVVAAARAAQNGASGAEIARLVMGLIPFTYLAFHVEVTDYLERYGLIEPEHDPGTGLSRSLLMIEDGHVSFLRRSRRRGTPVERLVEFVSEFGQVQDLALVHTGLGSGGSELATMLQEQLPQQTYTEHIYGPVLASFVGPVALGVVVSDYPA